jgi:hypothetical protein
MEALKGRSTMEALKGRQVTAWDGEPGSSARGIKSWAFGPVGTGGRSTMEALKGRQVTT